MKVEDKEVLEVFARVIPKLDDEEKLRLLYYGMGIEAKAEQQQTEKLLKRFLGDEAS